MRCEDFREITDSFLSGELLVETNHEVVRHLEECDACRRELKSIEDFRAKLRSAVINETAAQIDPAFAARLRAGLEESAKQSFKTGFRQRFLSLKNLSVTAAAALLIVTFAVGYALLRSSEPDYTQQADRTRPAPNDKFAAKWEKIVDQAIGDHQECGLEKMKYWLEAADRETEKRAEFRKTVLEKMRIEPSASADLLQVHDCYHDGRLFRHAIIRIGEHTVSVLFTETALDPSELNEKNPKETFETSIVSKKKSGFQVASFTGVKKAVFVISDLPEDENLNLARNLSDVLQS